LLVLNGKKRHGKYEKDIVLPLLKASTEFHKIHSPDLKVLKTNLYAERHGQSVKHKAERTLHDK
jgi:hypothetical protein